MSEIFPHEGTDAAHANRYAEPIHVYPALEPKFCAIVGRAVVTMVMSNAARKTLAHREAMMTTVCNFVREASGSSGGEASLGGVGLSFSMLELEAEPFDMSFCVLGSVVMSSL